jgi:putative oxidoreductase
MILRSLSQFRDGALLWLRIALGCFFLAAHGLPKLQAGMAHGIGAWRGLGEAMWILGIRFWPEFWGSCAVLSETVGIALFIAGFAFRPACILLTFTMFVAGLSAYKAAIPAEALVRASHPWELAIVFAALTFVGPGRYSIDRE